MPSKQQMKQTVYAELQNAVSGLVDSGDVVLRETDRPEQLPAVVYEEFSRSEPYAGGASTVRDDNRTDANGNTVHVYKEFYTLRFDVYPMAERESDKDDIYEAIRTHFNRYNMWLQPSDLHHHVKQVDVGDATDADVIDDDDHIRSDRLTIDILAYREQTRTP